MSGGRQEDLMAMLTGVACVCEQWAAVGAAQEVPQGSVVSPFQSTYRPGIGLNAYLLRLASGLRFEEIEPVFLVALVYLDRLDRSGAPTTVTHLTIHRMMAACLWASVKFLLDDHHDAATHSRLAGIPARETRRLEEALLQRLDWRLNVTSDDLTTYREALAPVCFAHAAPLVPTRRAFSDGQPRLGGLALRIAA